LKIFLIDESDEENRNILSNGVDFPWRKTSGNMNVTSNMPNKYLTTLNLEHTNTALDKGGGNVRESTP